MSGASMGRRRRRVYVRKFDWAEARERYARGESMASIAKAYGVNPSAVQRVVKLPAAFVAEASEREVARLNELRRDQRPCPRCERPKSTHAELCRMCANETRLLLPVTTKDVPGQRRVLLADVEVGRIVRVGTRYGVVMRGGSKQRARVVDFWDGGAEFVSDITVVSTAPTKRFFVGGVEEEPEEIAA